MYINQSILTLDVRRYTYLKRDYPVFKYYFLNTFTTGRFLSLLFSIFFLYILFIILN